MKTKMKIKFASALWLCCFVMLLFAAGCAPKKTENTEERKRGQTESEEKNQAKAADIVVKEGESIQAAMKKAKEGNIVEVQPGVYKETVTVDKHNITLRGVVDGDKRPVLEGENKLNDGVIASGNHFTMTGFKIQNYKGNGVTTQGSDGVTLTDLMIENTGLYGLYPVESKNILIENCKATKIRDAALYVGDCQKAVVRNNEVYGNVCGIEIENSVHSVVENNYAHDNAGGILVFALPGKVQKLCEDTMVRNNRVINNNTKNFGDPKSTVGRVPQGTGILIMAADKNVIVDNEIKGNQSFGVAMVELDVLEDPKKDPKLEPNPDMNQILNNTYENNGKNPQGIVKEMLRKGADIIWSGAGKNNCAIKPKGATTIGAENLPDCKPAAQNDTTNTSQNSMTPIKTGGENTASADAKKKTGNEVQVHVDIKALQFTPKHVTVHAGTRVVWTNHDNVTHSVMSGKSTTPDKSPLLNSGMLAPGATYSYTFTKPGVYTYLCQPHIYQAPMRDATVTVEK